MAIIAIIISLLCAAAILYLLKITKDNFDGAMDAVRYVAEDIAKDHARIDALEAEITEIKTQLELLSETIREAESVAADAGKKSASKTAKKKTGTAFANMSEAKPAAKPKDKKATMPINKG